ncbi:MAG: endo-1,4-beta-xylanase [Fibromonadaceae bacterium]|jgi:GH35 family endo-1,4-beta-xylanase|nr:endo-1,4-beta-xylanase [Fibromonadaceae bacterium]
MKIKVVVLIAFALQLVFAQTTVGLKDVYSSKFKFGNILNGNTVNNNTMKQLVLREFNSITPENELKPDATIVQNGSTNTNVKVQLGSGAKAILQFCQDNNIPVRGHTLVWHSQTPGWFFRENFNASGAVVSTAVMDQRMESYIKNMFELITTSYPRLNLYAYDVVNEASSESGGPRTAGSDAGNGQSMWVQVYKDNSFIEKAFTYARKYAPKTTKLFYNDYNEYISAKRNYIANSIVKPLKEKGLLDGMGMQSHLDVRTGSNPYPTASDYGAAITTYKNLGVEIHVSELDATIDNGNESYFSAQATYYKNIMTEILNKGGSAVTAVVIWGIRDDQSWRSSRKPLVFDANGNKKAAYNELVKLIPESDWGKTGSSSSVAVSSSSSKASSSSTAASSSSRASSSSVASSSSIRSSSSVNVASSSSGASSSSSTGTISSSSIAVSSSSNITESSSSSEEALSSSSSEEDTTPILGFGLSTQGSQLITYYSLKGEPLGNAKPQKAGIYIVKQGYSVKKIVVR